MLKLLPLLAFSLQVTCAFVSRPDLHPLNLTVVYQASNSSSKISKGHIFIAPSTGIHQAVQIFDHNLQPVYIGPDRTQASNHTYDFLVQRHQGKDVLTLWTGSGSPYSGGTGHGTNLLYDENYNVISSYQASEEFGGSDIHENHLANDGRNALVTAYKTVGPIDLTAFKGPKDGYVLDSCFQEIDLHSLNPKFTFCSLQAGIPLEASFATVGNGTELYPWDYFHGNSITKDALGNFLFNSRHLHALFYLNPSGKILWQLGGKNSSFSGNGTNFAWQHYARFRNEDGVSAQALRKKEKRYISLFNNAASNYGSNGTQSQGLLIELDLKINSSKLVKVYQNPGGQKLLAQSQGSFEFLSDPVETSTPDSSNVLMGYGALNYFAEYDKNGNALQLVTFKDDEQTVQNYRTFKQNWNGNPKGFKGVENQSKFNKTLTEFNPIDVRSEPDFVEKDSKLFFSWNGLVGIKEWKIEFGESKNDGKSYKISKSQITKSQGFESQVDLESVEFKAVKLHALGDRGRILAASDWKKVEVSNEKRFQFNSQIFKQ